MQKWEYRAIVGIEERGNEGVPDAHFPVVWSFTEQGIETARIEPKKDQLTRTGQLIYQMGLEGWEMVGVVENKRDSFHTRITIFFKRPIE